MPDSYFELRHQQVAAMAAAMPVFDALAAELETLTGRRLRPVEPYRLGGAERVVVCLGSTGGTVKDVVDELRDEHELAGLLRRDRVNGNDVGIDLAHRVRNGLASGEQTDVTHSGTIAIAATGQTSAQIPQPLQ